MPSYNYHTCSQYTVNLKQLGSTSKNYLFDCQPTSPIILCKASGVMFYAQLYHHKIEGPQYSNTSCNKAIMYQSAQSRGTLGRCSLKNVFLKISPNSQENRLRHVFSSQFCEIFRNTFFCRTPPGSCFLQRTVFSVV